MEIPRNLETHATTSHKSNRVSQDPSPQYLAAVAARQTILERLRDEDADELVLRLEKCGQEQALTCGCCGGIWTVKKRCNRKWCPVCQRALATRASLRYEGICESMVSPLFVTWTVKNWKDVEVDFIRHLRRSLGKLRRLAWWRRIVRGGIATVELTNIGNGWHPHLHTLLDCSWLTVITPKPAYGCTPQRWTSSVRAAAREVTEQWSLCTGLKSGMKIKRAKSKGQSEGDSISKEIIKYSCKGTDLAKLPGALAPVIAMLDNTRLLTSFGNCHGHLRDFDRPKQKATCDSCGNQGPWITEEGVRAIERQFSRNRRK